MLNLRISQIDFPKAKPVAISFYTWNIRQSYLLFLEYRGLQGIGEANPFKPITGDSPQELVDEAKKLSCLPLNPERDDIATLHSFLQDRVHCKSLQAALDGAYHDLIGKIKNVPVYRLYQDHMRCVPNSVTVFLQNTLEETAAEATDIYRRFPDLKILKIKLKGEGDIQRAQAIQSVSPAGMNFVLDANQGFTDPQRAVEVLTEIGKILKDVLVVEEPCPKGDLDKLKFVADHVSNMLVFADESASTLDAVKQVAAKRAAHGVNIKLQKAGGIWPAKQIAGFCTANGLKMMVGAMIEGPVAISQGVHFAVSTDNILFSDLDTDLDLPSYVIGQSPFVNGMREVNERSGLGISVDMQTTGQLQMQNQLVWRDI